jgi:hypothetical protein
VTEEIPLSGLVESIVASQVNFLRPVIPDAPESCNRCYGAVLVDYDVCYPCHELERLGGGRLADVVVPITYRIGWQEQGAHDLRAYKMLPTPSKEARLRLVCLFLYFYDTHRVCILRRIGASEFTHVAFVPSTKSDGGVHPLRSLISPFIKKPIVDLTLNTESSARGMRSFHRDLFTAPAISASGASPVVLLLDDTWVSGSRMQSAAYRLKMAGAHKVAAVALARQLRPDFAPAQPLVAAAKSRRFDPGLCVLHSPE